MRGEHGQAVIILCAFSPGGSGPAVAAQPAGGHAHVHIAGAHGLHVGDAAGGCFDGNFNAGHRGFHHIGPAGAENVVGGAGRGCAENEARGAGGGRTVGSGPGRCGAVGCGLCFCAAGCKREEHCKGKQESNQSFHKYVLSLILKFAVRSLTSCQSFLLYTFCRAKSSPIFPWSCRSL